MNVNLGQYALPAQTIDSTYFPDLTLSDTARTRIAGVVELALLPSTLFLQTIVWLVSRLYAFKPSPVTAVLLVSATGYWLNILFIPYISLQILGISSSSGYLPTWQYVAALLPTVVIIIVLNLYRLKNLSSSTEALLLRIDKRIEEIIKLEKTTGHQRIRTEALLTIKDVFFKLQFSSVDFSCALISAMFVAIKENAISNDPQQVRFEAETNQASSFLARAIA